MNEIEHVIMVDMDSLFDTRLTTLLDIDKNSIALLENGVWHNRYIDRWDHIDNELYKERYHNRTTDVLRRSAPTPMLDHITKLTFNITASNLSSPNTHYTSLIINTWPYDVRAEDKEEIAKTFKTATLTSGTVKLISIPIHEMGVSFFKQHNIEMLFYYDAVELLNVLGDDENIKTSPLVGTGLFAPDIIKNPDGYAHDKREKVFKEMEKFISPVITLQFIPVAFFSIRLIIKK